MPPEHVFAINRLRALLGRIQAFARAVPVGLRALCIAMTLYARPALWHLRIPSSTACVFALEAPPQLR